MTPTIARTEAGMTSPVSSSRLRRRSHQAVAIPTATPSSPATSIARRSGSPSTSPGTESSSRGTWLRPRTVTALYPAYAPVGVRKAPLSTQYRMGSTRKSRCRTAKARNGTFPPRRTR